MVPYDGSVRWPSKAVETPGCRAALSSLSVLIGLLNHFYWGLASFVPHYARPQPPIVDGLGRPSYRTIAQGSQHFQPHGSFNPTTLSTYNADVNVSLMITCLGDVVRPNAGKSVVRILRRLGHSVEFRSTQTCCGQPFFNSGFSDMAREQAKYTIGVFEGDEVVVTPSGSCAAMVKVEYPHLLHDEPEWHERALALAERTYEFTDFLVNHLGIEDVGAKWEGKVAYHFACHLRMLNQGDEVRKLVQAVEGATLVELAREDQCCGFGGSFSIRYPHISGAMVNDKANCVLDADADALVSTDAGCLMNIGGRLHRRGEPIPVLHVAEWLDQSIA